MDAYLRCKVHEEMGAHRRDEGQDSRVSLQGEQLSAGHLYQTCNMSQGLPNQSWLHVLGSKPECEQRLQADVFNMRHCNWQTDLTGLMLVGGGGVR